MPTRSRSERRLSRRARPDDAKHLPFVEREADVLHDELLHAGRRGADALHLEGLPPASAAAALSRRLRKPAQELRKPLPALARGEEALPVGDRQLDRRQRARGQDGAGDDDAGGRFAARPPERRRRRAPSTAASSAAPSTASRGRRRCRRRGAGWRCIDRWRPASAQPSARQSPWREAPRRCAGRHRR